MPASASTAFATFSTPCGGDRRHRLAAAVLARGLPPWEMVWQRSHRRLAAGCFEAVVHDLRAALRFSAASEPEPTAGVIDGQLNQSTPDSSGRTGYPAYNRCKGSKVQTAVDTLGCLLALHFTNANDRARDPVTHAGRRGDGGAGRIGVRRPRTAATPWKPRRPASDRSGRRQAHGRQARVCALAETLVVERWFGRAVRFRLLARRSERLTETLEGAALRQLWLADASDGGTRSCWGS